MKNLKNLILTFLFAALGTVVAMGAYGWHQNNRETSQNPQVQLAGYTAPLAPNNKYTGGAPFDFTYAAERTTDAVVHVKTKYLPKQTNSPMRRPRQDPFFDLFGDDFYRFFGDPYGGGNMQPNQPREAAGSGVIVDESGFIVTNNHVIEDADEIEVTLHDNRKFKAKLVGADADFDLAVLQIEEKNLPTISFGNSDSVKVGQWVLAVGNPFNLTSTVTAGIVSAKGRNINILEGKGGNGANTAIESFIQTDAAVNPGNSGGALVDLNGNLVGINTAIASTTGAYAGYSFAVPSNLVYKVYNDLKSYGIVQRGYLGVNIRSVDDNIAKELNLTNVSGVYVDNVIEKSAAEDAGLKSKDVIIAINGVTVKSAPELQEQVGRYRPGDKISVDYIRSGKNQSTTVTLKNKFNNSTLVSESKASLDMLGADFEVLTKQESANLKLDGGVRVKNLRDGKFKQYTDIQNGFIITFMDEKPVRSLDDIIYVLNNKKGNITVEGIYPNKPFSFLYAFKI